MITGGLLLVVAVVVLVVMMMMMMKWEGGEDMEGRRLLLRLGRELCTREMGRGIVIERKREGK